MWIIAVLAPWAFIFAAWVFWLLFNCLIARWYGLEGLSVAPPLAEAFRPRDWLSAIYRQPREWVPTQDDGSSPKLDMPEGMPGNGGD